MSDDEFSDENLARFQANCTGILSALGDGKGWTIVTPPRRPTLLYLQEQGRKRILHWSDGTTTEATFHNCAGRGAHLARIRSGEAAMPPRCPLLVDVDLVGWPMNQADADTVNDHLATVPIGTHPRPDTACGCAGGGSRWNGGHLCFCEVSWTADRFIEHGLTVAAKLFADHLAKRTAEEQS